jgi:hypothetical protein
MFIVRCHQQTGLIHDSNFYATFPVLGTVRLVNAGKIYIAFYPVNASSSYYLPNSILEGKIFP